MSRFHNFPREVVVLFLSGWQTCIDSLENRKSSLAWKYQTIQEKDQRQKSPTKWNQVTSAATEGGLGIRRLEGQIKAFQAHCLEIPPTAKHAMGEVTFSRITDCHNSHGLIKKWNHRIQGAGKLFWRGGKLFWQTKNGRLEWELTLTFLEITGCQD